jgi:hypothetical protein
MIKQSSHTQTVKVCRYLANEITQPPILLIFDPNPDLENCHCERNLEPYAEALVDTLFAIIPGLPEEHSAKAGKTFTKI